MTLITMEVAIDHGILTPKEPHLLPENGIGLLTVVRSDQLDSPRRNRVSLPLVHCQPGTIVNPSAEDLDESLWD